MAGGKPVGYLQRVVKGGIDHVSWKIKWPFHISRVKRFLYDQFFLLRLRTTAKGLPCSMSSPFSHFLFMVQWKGNWGLFLEVDAWHHLLRKQTHCHQTSRHRIQRAGLLQSNSWSYNFSQKIKNNMKENHSSRWIKHLILVSQIIIIKNHCSQWLPKSRFTRNRSKADFTIHRE